MRFHWRLHESPKDLTEKADFLMFAEAVFSSENLAIIEALENNMIQADRYPSYDLSIIMGSINLVLLVAAVIHIHEVICVTCAKCPHGWWHSPLTDFCYIPVCKATLKKALNYREAENHCMKQGGHLASIHSKDEDYFIYALWTHKQSAETWIGQKKNLYKKWAWTDDSLINYTNWQEEHPDYETEDAEICGVMDVGTLQNGKWIDRSCDIRLPHVTCKKPSYMTGS
ncbi:C-type mannose receptor 2 [Toxocara canis]|uniref:C-type mannose receptor 2 n=1 Tax=Toxocara canis TaxID=6265 RepID=A0A0B2UTA4_TOXCA|nr:C-type mannose receptor 2 [Toxocara canis]